MLFSARTNWELTPNKITQLLGRLRQEGEKVLDLTESNPTRCGFSYPQDKVLEALAHPANLTYAPSPQGILEAREALCRYYARQGRQVEPQNVFLTASTSEAYAFLFRLLADPDDNILSPRPSYPLFDFLAGLNDVELRPYSLAYQNGWRLDLERLRQEMSPQTRAVVLVNPNNPTGSFIKDEEVRGLNAACAGRDIALISDEVFYDYQFTPGPFPTMADNKEQLTFTLGGLSKSLGFPQMKISWIIISGPATDVAAARARLEVIADTYLSVNTPAQNALGSWLELQPAIQGGILERVRKNRQVLLKLIVSEPSCRCLKAEGGWYAVLQSGRDIDEEAFVIELLERDRVFVHPGYFFDFPEGPYFVVSLLPPPEVFEQGAARLLGRLR